MRTFIAVLALLVFFIPLWILLAGMGLAVHGLYTIALDPEAPMTAVLALVAGVLWLLAGITIRWRPDLTTGILVIAGIVLAWTLTSGWQFAIWLPLAIAFSYAALRRWQHRPFLHPHEF